jgi:predicted transposase/invertase (TIGR01784 family)
VEDCIEKGILVDFLRTHSLEVINMLTAEFKLEDAQQVWKEEGIEEGIEKGEEEMAKKMARNLLSNGIPLDVIAQSAGMSLERIRGLVN